MNNSICCNNISIYYPSSRPLSIYTGYNLDDSSRVVGSPGDTLGEHCAGNNMTKKNFCQSIFVSEKAIKSILWNLGKSIISRSKDSEWSASGKSISKICSTNSSKKGRKALISGNNLSDVTSRERIDDIRDHVNNTIVSNNVSFVNTL